MIRIILKTVPTAQARARHAYVKALARTMSYKSREQQANERTLEALLAPYQPSKAMTGAISLEIACYLPIPSSLSQKKKDSLHLQSCPKKPDIDNYIKQIMDAMTRLRFWEDDKQVVSVKAIKLYSYKPQWDIKVGEMDSVELTNKQLVLI